MADDWKLHWCVVICYMSDWFANISAVMTPVRYSTDFNKKMENHVFKTLHVIGLAPCVYECMVEPKCLSTNFYPDDNVCELNSEDSVTSPASLVSHSGFIQFFDISAWPTRIAKECEGVSCAMGKRCHRGKPKHACLKSECDDPPAIMHASLTANSTQRGVKAKVTYQCGDGLILRGDPQLTCKGGHRWSKIKFKCVMPGSCDELKRCDSSYMDGEYWLYPAHYGDVMKVRVYCHGMDTDKPKDYISLTGTNNAHYDASEAYDYWESTCNFYDKVGDITTTFTKIGINIEDMIVVVDDFKYSSTSKERSDSQPMNYGKGGDCTFAHGCRPRQGWFYIDTSNTGLIVDKELSWTGYGWGGKFHDFIRSEDGRTITARCGGKCGGCQPEKAMQLVINTNEVLDASSATLPVCI